MEITPQDIKGLIGLFVSFIIMLVIGGWSIYSLYIRPGREERKKHL